MKDIVPKDRRLKGLSAFFSVFVTIALSINLGAKSESFTGLYKLFNNLIASLSSYDISRIFLLILFYFFFLYCIGILKQAESIKKEIICAGIPALLFGIFMAIGYSYKSKGNWSLVFGNAAQLLKAGTYSLGYAILFFFGIVMLFHLFDKWNIYEAGKEINTKHKYIRQYFACLEKKPFVTSFLTMLVCYIPYMIMSFPGILMGDAYSQIAQGYNLETYQIYFELISDNVKLNNSHPVLHTVLIHICLRIGELFNNFNLGLGLYSLIQIVFVLAVIAWLFSFLKELGISMKIRVIFMLYYVLHPRVSAYMYLMTKDVIFTAFLMAFFTIIFRILRGEENKKMYAYLAGSILGTMLFRNDGIIIVLPTVLGMILGYKKLRKQFCFAAAGILVFSFLWNSVLLPGLQITGSGRRDTLSFPFQQTARYIRDAGDEVTEEEKQAIDKILRYDTLADKYNPTLSDPVKATFREKTATTEDMLNYFKVWFQMFLKHPDIYAQATLHHKYDMLYFNSGKANNYSYSLSTKRMADVNNVPDDKLPVQLSYPESLKWARDWYETLREGLFSLPVINILMVPAAYINLFVLWIFYGIRKKCNTFFVLGLPVFIQLILIFFGPCNATYFRYVYPIVMLLPIMLLVGLHTVKQEKTCS